MSPTEPLVSVNLCCYNSERFLDETLQSIFAQTYPHWELVIINDGSTDSTEQIIRRHLAAGWPITYHAQANAGLGRSRNKAIELSQGEFIALIDHDDLWQPEKLRKQMAVFVERPTVGLTYTRANKLYPNSQEEPYSTLPLHRGRVLSQLVLSDFVVCSTVVMRRSALEEVGTFDPKYVQVEEYDLMLRIAERYEFDFVDECLAKYRLHEQNASWDSSRVQTELVMLMGEVLERNPQLVSEIGAHVARLRMTGLDCTPGQANVLRGQLTAARQWYGGWAALLKAMPKLAVRFVLSCLPPAARSGLLRHWRAARRWWLIK